MKNTDILNRLNNVFLEESPEKEKNVKLSSTRGGEEPKDYEYAVTHAQPDDK
jgi:hypothetical protein